MLSENGLRVFSDILIADVEGYYTYKSGSQIVKFFNENFGFSDTYGQGFPSRWAYALEGFKKIFNSGQFDKLLNLMLSKHFIMRDMKLTDVEALEHQQKTLDYINGELRIEGHRVIKRGAVFTIVDEDSDLEFLGEGGFANVYKSKSTGLIVKKLKDDFKTHASIRSRFKREFDITKSLSVLDGVIKVFEYNDSDISYTMEEAELTLQNFISENDHNEATQINMIRQVLYIISEVHRRNIIHRDICPNNILIMNGRLKISDFGLGKDLDMFHSHRTMRTQAIGTYAYCAPEQFMQLKDGDKRSDVYSLGSLINFIMTGDPWNNKHFLRNPADKARNENSNMRYEDASALLKSIEQAISFHQSREKQELIKSKVNSKLYDEDVENYIYGLDAVSLCKAVISIGGMDVAIINFFKDDDKRLVDILNMLNSEYSNVCGTWTDYDDFASIAYHVIYNGRTYVAQQIATEILYDIAYNTNRFNAQRLIDSLIERGVDPTIEDALKR